MTIKEEALNRQRITIRDVAKDAQVSISTVSRYLHDDGSVDQKTAARVASAVERLQYTPSIAAQSLRMKNSRIILLVVPDICNPFYSQIAKTVQRLAREKNYVVALFDSEESFYEREAIRAAAQMYASGILLGSIDVKPAVIKEIQSARIPVVGLNAYQQYPFDTVHVHGSEGTYIATRHLIALGHKMIGFAGGTPDSMIGISRYDGFRAALQEAGLPLRRDHVIQIGFSQSDGYEAGRKFSKIRPLPSAICCANDQIALGLLSALQERDIQIPDDVSVTGMDNIPYARISNPSLTSVTNDSVAFATEGMRMLLERISGSFIGEPRDVAIRHELIIRASVKSIWENQSP